MIKNVRKRDGTLEKFNQEKITSAIHRAFFEVGIEERKRAEDISKKVVRLLEKRFKIPTVEEIQDTVEEVLAQKYKKVAEAYSIYRKKKEKIRNSFGIKLTFNAMTVLEKRYLLKKETPEQMFRRVARTVAGVEKRYGCSVRDKEQEFFRIMSKLEFLPNSPTLMNAGTRIGQLSACFVLPIEDDLKSIFEAVKNTAIIEQSGGGVGFSFSKLRPRGDVVRSTHGIASGPVSFMRVFDTATDVIKQGGKRRGAMMGILNVNHPDILEFITAKSKEHMFQNFNISVAITNRFMKAVKNNAEYRLINPRTKRTVKKLKAREVWNAIIENAWKTGDPGVIFIDEINRHNPTPFMKIESTNPCGEVDLLPWESCNLGSINLTKMLRKRRIDWKKLRNTVRTAVHFLDNVIDANRFPLKKTEIMTKANRKIGLGVMGFAEMLILLGVPYNSRKALKIAEKLMKFISKEARKKSVELGKERGSFPNFSKSVFANRYPAMRNATVTAIAPTGSISIIAGCSSGIEPLFAICFVRNVLGGKKLLEINPIFERIAKERGFYSSKLMIKIARSGTVQNMKEIPESVRRIFVTALDIKPEWHVRMQSAWQKYTDNSVSKTINLPKKATKKDVKKAFELAYKLKCKGITVYRYGSKKSQVLSFGKKFIFAHPEYSGGCLTRICPVV